MSDLPLSDWLARSEGVVGIAFTDLVGSTSLLFSRETLNFTKLLRSHRSRAATLAAELQGRLIDATADGLLAAFPTASGAFDFASGLLEDPGQESLQIRAGVHHGRVRAEGSGLIGRNVHLGARVMQHAGDGELWVSDAARAALEVESPRGDDAWLESEECELKGVPTPQRLWRAR